MGKATLWSLVLLSFSGALAQINLNGKVFVFPKTSKDSYVLLKPSLLQPLQQLTVCLRFFTDLTRVYSLFSASSRQHDNEILLIKHPAEYHACIGGQCLVFAGQGNAGSSRHWKSACMTWNSATGIVQLWLDGQPLPRKGAARGYSIQTDLVVMLGQEQDSYGGSLDEGQSFVGEIREVYMWDAVLPPEQLMNIRREAAPTPLVDWTALNFEIKGYVVIEPHLEADLNGKVFVFPKTSKDSYVLLKPSLVQPLQQLTVCLRFFTDLTRVYSLFSASSLQHDNEILLIKHPAEYHVCIGGQCLVFAGQGNAGSSSHWKSACMTWNSATGIVQLWLDGQPLPRKGAVRGYSIQTDLVVMLGQEQDSYGGSLDEGQSFVGEIREVYMWDAVLPPEQLMNIRREAAPTPLVDWTALNFEIKGYVVIEPTIQ